MSEKPKIMTTVDVGSRWHGEKPDTRRKMNLDKKQGRKKNGRK